LIVGRDGRAPVSWLTVDPNLTDAKHVFEGTAVAPHRLVEDLGNAVAVNLIVAKARGFSRGTEQQ